MDASYGAQYEDLYRRHWWWRAREAALLHELIRVRPARGYLEVLDVGCGNGLFFDKLAVMGDVEGVEPETALLDPDGPWRNAIHAVPFDERFNPGKRYQLILMLDVLEHLDDPVGALRHAVRLLAPNGVLVATVPAFQWLWTRHDDLNHHRRRYDRPSFRALAAEAGLEIIQERYLFQWLVGAKLLTRWMEKLSSKAPAPPRVPPEPVNSILYGISRIQEIVTRVIRVPWGGSLMVTGKVPAALPPR